MSAAPLAALTPRAAPRKSLATSQTDGVLLPPLLPLLLLPPPLLPLLPQPPPLLLLLSPLIGPPCAPPLQVPRPHLRQNRGPGNLPARLGRLCQRGRVLPGTAGRFVHCLIPACDRQLPTCAGLPCAPAACHPLLTAFNPLPPAPLPCCSPAAATARAVVPSRMVTWCRREV